ncbi:hypothetical protein [uncultured Methanomethylovorans sp.]|uniref:hypothetical protein n=1 Tax=uncultured Methanomethylovorans sp. TaxID=183759 RepID=UPI002AA64B34|nr:hypothetical protein [uncultured Methanomethylovorans sp.]
MTTVQIIDLIPERETSVAPIVRELEQQVFPLEKVKEQLLELNSSGKIELIKRRILGRTRAQLNHITIPYDNINYTHVRRSHDCLHNYWHCSFHNCCNTSLMAANTGKKTNEFSVIQMSDKKYKQAAKKQIERYINEKLSLIQALNKFPVAPI